MLRREKRTRHLPQKWVLSLAVLCFVGIGYIFAGGQGESRDAAAGGRGEGAQSGGSNDAAGAVAPLPDEIVIGYQIIPNGEIIAKNMGWHEETLGIPVRWVQVDSGRDLNTGIASGSIDLGLGGSSTTVAAIAQGVPGEVFWIYDIIGENEALVVGTDSGIESVSDLVGKRVAAPFGATTHYHLLAALDEYGVDPDTVEIFDMQPPEMLAAWQRGDIDAGFVWEPTLAKMLEFDGRVLISSGELAARGYVTGDIGLVRRGFAEEYPHIVTQYVATLHRAVEFYRSNPAEAARAVSEEFGITAEEAARQMDSLVWLNASEQIAAEYLGTPDAVGALADVFLATGRFLYDQGTLQAEPTRDTFVDAINPEYAAGALQAAGQ